MIELNALQQDVLREFLNIGTGRAVGKLNQLTGQQVTLTIPNVQLVPVRNLGVFTYQVISVRKAVAVTLPFLGEYSGKAVFFMTDNGTNRLVDHLLGSITDPGIREDTFKEIGNIFVNSVVGCVGELLEVMMHFKPPRYFKGSLLDILLRDIDKNSSSICLLNRVSFSIEELSVDGHVILIFQNMDINGIIWKINQMCAKLRGIPPTTGNTCVVPRS